jgi:hypothetical protein
LYVDDGRFGWDDTPDARQHVDAVKEKLTRRFGIKWGEDDPEETHFLGANIYSAPSRESTTIKATSYIDLQVKRFFDGDVSPSQECPAHWSHLPADDELMRAWEAAMATRTPASEKLTKDYGSLFGAVLHAGKYRPEILAPLSLLGSCLTFPTDGLMRCLRRILVYLARTKQVGTSFSKHVDDAHKLKAYCDANWSVTRSQTGFVIMLAGATINAVSRRQHCITMSSCESELVALADCAIELLHVTSLVNFLGHETPDAIEVHTDSKAAFDLCHRFTSAQNSRHVDRKLFKMRELRGAGRVVVRHIPGESNPADILTKVLSRQPFEKHRKVILNLPGDTGAEYARRVARRGASSLRDETSAPGTRRAW